jgi:ATP-dependent RNA helicase DeaD
MLYNNKDINKALEEMGFEDFTEIQAKAIPLLNDGVDIIGHSQTGTGKTAAFTLPILSSIDVNNEAVQAVVLCPTRELAVQVQSEMLKIGKYMNGLRILSVYGGEPISRQIKKLKKRPQIIVATPGRLIDHINRKLIRLGSIKYLVLDEADEMLKMGFIEDIETILSETPSTRQTTLFSATMPKPIIKLSKKYMTDPQLVSVVDEEQSNKDITQYYYQVHDKNKIEAVGRLLHIYQPKLTLIFCNTKRKVDEVTQEFISRGYNADKIHGDLQQTSRLDVLNKFHSGVLDIMVATDVAARGLDIKNVEAVINFEVPEKAEFYVHRIGRTGRIGKKGFSFTLVSKKELPRFRRILDFTKSNIKKRNIPSVEKVSKVKEEKDLEQLITYITSETHSEYYDMAYKLLVDYEPEVIVAALLNKIDDKDATSKVQGDINEEFSSKGRRERSRAPRKDMVRFHVNLGSKVGLTPKKLAGLVQEKTNLRNNDIDDITIRPRFAYFSVKKKHKERVMKDMSKYRFNGKNGSIQIAKDRH